MKIHHLILPIALFALAGCEPKQTTTEKAKDNINDALDRRPGEKARDVAEDTKDAVKDVAKDIKGGVKDATR
ncbi:MAG: hypothetical protein ABIZ56_03835 [Chthoniobacteraceae bacterium]